jgi:hypothetical protein
LLRGRLVLLRWLVHRWGLVELRALLQGLALCVAGHATAGVRRDVIASLLRRELSLGRKELAALLGWELSWCRGYLRRNEGDARGRAGCFRGEGGEPGRGGRVEGSTREGETARRGRNDTAWGDDTSWRRKDSTRGENTARGNGCTGVGGRSWRRESSGVGRSSSRVGWGCFTAVSGRGNITTVGRGSGVATICGRSGVASVGWWSYITTIGGWGSIAAVCWRRDITAVGRRSGVATVYGRGLAFGRIGRRELIASREVLAPLLGGAECRRGKRAARFDKTATENVKIGVIERARARKECFALERQGGDRGSDGCKREKEKNVLAEHFRMSFLLMEVEMGREMPGKKTEINYGKLYLQACRWRVGSARLFST